MNWQMGLRGVIAPPPSQFMVKYIPNKIVCILKTIIQTILFGIYFIINWGDKGYDSPQSHKGIHEFFDKKN